MFESKIEHKGSVTFPEFTGTRLMMLPFRLDDLSTLTVDCPQYVPFVSALVGLSSVKDGVGYLTIDEAFVEASETHRRPGIHVDGQNGAWGGGGGGYARNGMFVASTRVGCQGWHQAFVGEPGPDGECAHMSDQCGSAIVFQPNQVYWCSPKAVHESLPLTESGPRSFVRLSMPSTADWHEGYSRNSLGVRPGGRIMSPRAAYMAYRQ